MNAAISAANPSTWMIFIISPPFILKFAWSASLDASIAREREAESSGISLYPDGEFREKSQFHTANPYRPWRIPL